MTQPSIRTDVRSTSRVFIDSIFEVIHRGIDHVTRPERDPFLDFLSGVGPMLPSLAVSLKTLLTPDQPMEVDGPNVKQVKREFAAEEARLLAEHREKHARLVAEFGPRFVGAERADEGAPEAIS